MIVLIAPSPLSYDNDSPRGIVLILVVPSPSPNTSVLPKNTIRQIVRDQSHPTPPIRQEMQRHICEEQTNETGIYEAEYLA